MNKKEFMKQLEEELRHISKEEKQEALLYYHEYFDDAGPEREEEVIRELGSPKDVAAQILKDVAIKRLDEPMMENQTRKRRSSTVWIVILALCAAPIGLPLLIAVFAVGLALAIAVFAIVLAIGFTGLVLCVSAVLCVGVSICVMPLHIIDGITICGAGLLCFGIGLLLMLATGYLALLSGKGMRFCAKRLLSGGKKS